MSLIKEYRSTHKYFRGIKKRDWFSEKQIPVCRSKLQTIIKYRQHILSILLRAKHITLLKDIVPNSLYVQKKLNSYDTFVIGLNSSLWDIEIKSTKISKSYNENQIFQEIEKRKQIKKTINKIFKSY